MDISERIRELLRSEKCKWMSQNKIADEIGISHSVLSKLSNGKFKAPSADIIMAIAKYFDVTMDWIMGLSECRRADSNCAECGFNKMQIGKLQNALDAIAYDITVLRWWLNEKGL